MNPLKTFIEDECITGAELFVAVAKLRQRYDTWVNTNGVYERLSVRDFNMAMRENGYKQCPNRVNGKVVKCWSGIGLRNDSVNEN